MTSTRKDICLGSKPGLEILGGKAIRGAKSAFMCWRSAFFTLMLLLLSAPSAAQPEAREFLSRHPLIDGHNDLVWQFRKRANNNLKAIDLRTSTAWRGMHTDMPRLRRGGLGAQFWSIYLPTDQPRVVTAAHNQIRLALRLFATYPELQQAFTADDIVSIHARGKVASLMGVEGGHMLGGSLAQLRWMYQQGVRYLTLTHSQSNELADSSNGPRRHRGLSNFGRQVVTEMNRLGMLIDLSHVSDETMIDALELSYRPVVFTHSNARALCNSPRNVPDKVLTRLKENGGIIMVSFVPEFVSEAVRTHRSRRASLSQVVDHIDHVVNKIGVDHVGIGSDFDGITEVPSGLEDVSKFPGLVRELFARGYSEKDVAKILGGNLLRVLRAQQS